MTERGPEESIENPEVVRNFNDTVWVKITPHGERVWAAHHWNLGIQAPPIKRDEQGYTEMPMWEIANVFGKDMFNGQPNLPLEMSYRTEAPQK